MIVQTTNLPTRRNPARDEAPTIGGTPLQFVYDEAIGPSLPLDSAMAAMAAMAALLASDAQELRREKKSIVPYGYKVRYEPFDDSCGDEMAAALGEMVKATDASGKPYCDLAILDQIATANGVDLSRYAHLNPGQQRMNVGNRLRGMLKGGKVVTVGKHTFG